MAPSSHPGHGDGHTLGNGIGLPAKLRVGSQIPSVKGYNIFPCSVFPERTKPNPSTAVAVFQRYGALVKLEGPTPHPVDFPLVTETSTVIATATTAPEFDLVRSQKSGSGPRSTSIRRHFGIFKFSSWI